MRAFGITPLLEPEDLYAGNWREARGCTGSSSPQKPQERPHRLRLPPHIAGQVPSAGLPASSLAWGKRGPVRAKSSTPQSTTGPSTATDRSSTKTLSVMLPVLLGPTSIKPILCLQGNRVRLTAESICANEFAQLSRKVFAGAHLARPHDQNAPSLISQRFDCSFVSPYVCGEFVFPKLSVRLWRGSVFTPRMAMPIASMYEDGFLFRTENDIGTTRQLLDVRIEIISQCRQTTLYRLFRCRVSPPHGGHPSTGFWRWIHQPFDPFV